ncbi:MAG: serine/threonine-protein kinase, partial [Myxococcota bacterium]
LSTQRTMVERFRREAQVVSKVRHPNVIEVIDFGMTQTGQNFLVMEYIEGRTLADIIAKEAPFTPYRAAKIARQVAAGLHEAHQQGFIHRDIKPSNIIVRTNGRDEYVKILDFGIARATTSPATPPVAFNTPIKVEGAREQISSITGAGRFVGTPLYMAPEQSRDPQNTLPSADLYSLGVILYEMLVGQPPFATDRVVDLFVMHSTAPVPHLPPSQGMELLVHWLLEKRPDRRPSDAAEVVSELDRLASARTYGVQLRPPHPGLQIDLDSETIDSVPPDSNDLTPSASFPAASSGPAAYPTPAPTPSFPFPLVESRLGTLAPPPGEPLDHDYLQGRLDYVTDRLARGKLSADVRAVLEVRLRRVQASLRTDADTHALAVVARDITDIDRDLSTALRSTVARW